MKTGMQRLLTIRLPAITAIAWLIGSGACFAQLSPTPGMGTTSPLGTVPSGPAPQLGGVPLGATELNIPGISPAPCSTGGGGNQTGSSSTTFDGGGIGTSSSSGQAGCGTEASAGASASSTPGTSGAGNGGAGTIPLDSTELATPGESQILTMPSPGLAAPMPGLPLPTPGMVPGSGQPSAGLSTTPCTALAPGASSSTAGPQSGGLANLGGLPNSGSFGSGNAC
jgi:hypothetical protein